MLVEIPENQFGKVKWVDVGGLKAIQWKTLFTHVRASEQEWIQEYGGGEGETATEEAASGQA